MATKLRETSPEVLDVATAFNDLKDYVVAQLRTARADMVSIAADAAGFATPALLEPGFHNDRSEITVTAADASSLATSLTLCNQILGVYSFHMADTLSHKVTGVALASYVPASTLAQAITKANDVKSKYNTHRASTTYHYTADGTNVVTAADATIQSELNTLLNDIKVQLIAHVASGAVCKSLRAVSA